MVLEKKTRSAKYVFLLRRKIAFSKKKSHGRAYYKLHIVLQNPFGFEVTLSFFFWQINMFFPHVFRYGVIDVFEAEDLLELKNIPKVTKCLAQLSKLAASDKDNLLNSF